MANNSDEPTLLIIDLMILLSRYRSMQVIWRFGRSASEHSFRDEISIRNCSRDNYKNQESIESGERTRRGAVQMHELRNITSPTPLPVQQKKMLSNPKNKTNTSNLLNTWISRCEEQPGYEIYLSSGLTDINRAVRVVRNIHTDVPQLGSNQEEADSRMFLNAAYEDRRQELGVKRVVLWSVASDVAAMCPMYSERLGPGSKIRVCKSISNLKKSIII